MLHSEVLTEESRKFFSKLTHFKEDFYLAGGTALALQLGHRISVDFDLFSPIPIKKTLLARIEEIYKEASIELLTNNSRELTILTQGVKHTFLHYPFPRILPFQKNEIIDLLSAKEIFATKAYSIGRRGVFKDYIDLYVGMNSKTSSLQEIINLAQEKYGEVFNDRLFLEQLVYLDDVSEDVITMFDRPIPTRQNLIDFFSGEIAQLKL